MKSIATLSLSLLLVLFGSAVSARAGAAEAYNPQSHYPGGSEVTYNNKVFRAKWYANPGQSPAAVATAANAWETPWVLTDKTPPPAKPDTSKPDTSKPDTSKPGTGKPDTSKPDTSKPDTSKPDTSKHPQYVAGTAYKGGDIVTNYGLLYLCNEGVTVPWCSAAAWAYEPGVGTAWAQAWSRTDGTTPKPDTPKPGTPKPGTPKPDKPTVKTGDSIALSVLQAKERALTSSPLMVKVKNSIRTRPNSVVEGITAGAATNPENVRRVEKIITSAKWEYLFPRRAKEYTYLNFLKAVAKFPAFCGAYSDGRDASAICNKSLAVMFAHFAQETGGHTKHWAEPEWRQGLHWVREMGWTEQMRGGYNGECNPAVWQGQTWPCGKFENGDFKSYFGRGSKQLSYNYNYGPFSLAMYGTVRTLLDKPELVADTWLNLASAVFFFVYPQPPKPSMLHVIDGTWQPNSTDRASKLTPGFGVTTQIINGGVECGGTVEVAQSKNRISYYRSFAKYLNVPIAATEVLGCRGMKQFAAEGAGALAIYWEQDWSWSKDTSDGRSLACKLVGYQTPFSAFTPGDYVKCVQKHFDVKITNP